MARRKQSTLEDIIDISSLLPWWAGLLLAITSFFILNHFANIENQPAQSISQMGQHVTTQLYITFAKFGQFVLPFCFTIGAITSAFKQRKRSNLFASVESPQFDRRNYKSNSGSDAVSNMSWQEFEMLVSEFFRKQGYSVIENGGGGPDGGVDLRIRKDDKILIVQCKHWKTHKVGVKIVREQLGIKTAQGADGVIIVTSGLYTDEAANFANEQQVTLIDGRKLKDIISETKKSIPVDLSKSTITPNCPLCSSLMVARTAKKGKSAGSKFWGCSRFPKCRGTISQ